MSDTGAPPPPPERDPAGGSAQPPEQPPEQPPGQQAWTPPTHTPPPPPGYASQGYPGPGQQPQGYGQPGYYPSQPAGSYPGSPGAPEDPGAQNALIVGIVSLALGLMCGIGFFGSPFALVMGLRSKRRIDAARGALSGRGNAQAGFVLGLVGTILLALAVLAFVLIVVILIAGFSAGDFEISDGTAA